MAKSELNLSLWEKPVIWNIATKPLPMRKRCLMSGRPGCVDKNAILHGEYGQQLLHLMENYIRYPNEMDPVLLKKLRAIGLVKRLFHPDALYEKWSLYTPLSLEQNRFPGRQYPLLLLLHGATMPIFWEEQTGYLPIAAREEMILACPQDHRPDSVLSILQQIFDMLPVDKTRIYCAGYSQGGLQTNRLTLAYPEIFAASAPCGGAFCLNETMLSSEQAERVHALGMPAVIVCGQEESLEELPVNRDSQYPELAIFQPWDGVRDDPTLDVLMDGTWLPRTASAKLALLNRRLALLGHAPVSPAEPTNVICETVQHLGFAADKSYERTILGVRHDFGDFFRADGACGLRLIGIAGINHWPPATMAELAWDFMRQFTREPDTGRSVYCPCSITEGRVRYVENA